MPQLIADLLDKVPDSQLRITIVLVSIFLVTGGSGYQALSSKIDHLREQTNKRDAEIEKSAAEHRVMLQTMSSQIGEIHSYYLQKGLSGRKDV